MLFLNNSTCMCTNAYAVSCSSSNHVLSYQYAISGFFSCSRTLRRKPSSVKRLSPTPSLGINSAPHTTSYYSESVINESYLTDDRGFSLKTNAAFDEPLESSSYWSKYFSEMFCSLHVLKYMEGTCLGEFNIRCKATNWELIALQMFLNWTSNSSWGS